MKKIFYTIAILSLAFIYSCSKDGGVTDPETPGSTAGYNLVDSIPHSYIPAISMVDENNIYFVCYAPYPRAFRINNGIRTEINFSESGYRPSYADALNNSYYVFAGSNGFRNSLKIFNGGALSTVIIDSFQTHNVTAVKILEAGKIVVASDTVIFLYNNGSWSRYPKAYNDYTYLIAGTSGRIDFAAYTFSSPVIDRIYRLEGNTLSLINEETGANFYPRRYRVGESLVKFVPGTVTNYFYLNGTSWSSLFSYEGSPKYLIGESLSRVFVLGTGKIWNGSAFVDDPAVFPTIAPSIYLNALSNVKSDVYFLGFRGGPPDTVSYVYRRK